MDSSPHFAQRRRVLLGGTIIPLVFASRSHAAPPARYPDHPIRFVIPSPAGGTGDLLARLIAPALGDALGQIVVVDDRPGAVGRIAMEQVVKAPPDGYTLYLANNATTLVAPNDLSAA